MQVILTEEEYNALAGRHSIKAIAQVREFRRLLGEKLGKNTVRADRFSTLHSVDDATISFRTLARVLNEAFDEVFPDDEQRDKKKS